MIDTKPKVFQVNEAKKQVNTAILISEKISKPIFISKDT